jgi:multiple sugar transport system ATP-binding protein
MASIQIDNVTKYFGNFRAVDEVSLNIDDGEFMVFVGPSGCGKTTTLNMIAGFEEPSGGVIRIGDVDVTDREPGERDLGMVFQSLALFPHMSVKDNIEFGLLIKKVPADEVARRMQAVVDTMKIGPLIDKRPGQLSGGEAQRVALARTIVNNPSAFLMDEPLSSLDAKLRVEMRTELKRLHTSLKSTFIYVTHDQAEAMTMADRIAVMNQGRIQQVGSPLDIYRNPVNIFVAGFFGVPAMNFIEGAIETENGAAAFRAGEVQQRFNGSSELRAGSDVTLGVRPESIELVREGGAGAGTVDLTETLGDETLLFVDYGGDGNLVVKTDPYIDVRPGDRVSFKFKDEGVRLFDKSSGDSIQLHA